MRVVVTGGGTGGHIYPALAVAEALKDDPSLEALLFVGKAGGMEAEIVTKAGVAFVGIDFFGMPRTPSFKLVQWFLALERAKNAAKALLLEQTPDVVFATGGYVTAPVVMAAQKLGIPTVIHEPDAMPGKANQQLAPKATLVTAAFPQARLKLKNKHFEATGNPLRKAMGHVSKAEALQRLEGDTRRRWQPTDRVLVVTGGSQGAKTLNDAVVGALPYLLNELQLRIIHQTGVKGYDDTIAAANQAGFGLHPGYRAEPFLDDMAAVYGAADLAVCRAGSLTLSELFCAGVPAILVPYPFAAANHQHKNAQAAQDAGAAVLLEDKACNSHALSHLIYQLLADPGRLPAMRQFSRSLAHPDATDRIVDHLRAIATGSSTAQSSAPTGPTPP